MKSEDQAIREAAGLIMWHLARRHTMSKAVAEASARQPALTDSEIGYAAQWAQSAMLFTQLLRDAKDSEDVVQLAYIAGLPVFEDDNGTE